MFRLSVTNEGEYLAASIGGLSDCDLTTRIVRGEIGLNFIEDTS